MKLLRFGERGSEKPGLLDANGTIRDLSGHVDDIGPATLAPDALARLAGIDPSSLPAVDAGVRLGPCVGNVGKLPCIGLNYSDHAAETGSPEPSEPIIFMKATSAINGPNDPVIAPRDSTKLDWEVELGVVIGRRASYVEEDEALDYVAGYCVVNDVSEREFQTERPGRQWTKGKSCDTFAPIGPWMVTKDEVPDPQALHMWLEVNGRRFQDGNTGTMIFGVKTIVSFTSCYMTLEPGDVIPTGTPPGVGAGRKPQIFLKKGDVVRLGIDGLGEQRQEIAAWPG